MKHIRSIILRNFISPISIAIYILAAGLLFLGEPRDAWFISFVIVINSIIACIQEIRAYLTLKKIELMSAPRAKVFKNGELIDVIFTELKKDDEISLSSGDEIPADCKILSANSFEVNESMLTGESIAIPKKKNDKILSGAIVVSGDARAIVIAVGDDTEAGKMTKKLKAYKPSLTPLQQQIGRVISILTYFAALLAGLVIWRYTVMGESHVVILKTITSAAVVVVPEGLLLASSLFFAYGSLKLLQAKVLPQKISAIEDMALLQVLATDKTGTLTSPQIIFNSLQNLSDLSDEQIGNILYSLNNQTKNKNATASAILAKFNKSLLLEATDSMSFSSARKLSGATLKINRKNHSIVFGAPEFILKNLNDKKQSKKLQAQINNLAESGLRVLLLAEFEKAGKIQDLLNAKTKLKPLAIISLKNELRPKVRETVDFLQKRGVSVRVISGDNPLTVSFIAKEAGIKNSAKFITGAELAELSDQEFDQAVIENTIFARVLPDQKERIISTFQKHKLYTGMIGDGVNDALAIKQSNLGISMFDAAPATRRVADLVLMDNSFTSLPQGVEIGNRIMISIEMIAILFFHKIVLGVTILLIMILAGIEYPFLPRHLTYMNFILVTLPTVLATILPPLPSRKINPQDFWKDTFYKILPIAILSGLAISSIYLLLHSTTNGDSYSIRATAVLGTAYFGISIAILSEEILGAKFTKATLISRGLYLLITAIFTVSIFSSKLLLNFFELRLPSNDRISLILLCIGTVSVLQIGLVKFFNRKK